MMPRDFLSDENEIVTDKMPPRDFLSEPPKESFGAAALKAPFRVKEDLYKHIFNSIKNIPGYIDSSKTEIPGVASAITNHPLHALGQAGAGLAEYGQNVFNFPHDAINYLSKRLNLVPKEFNEKVQMGRMPEDTKEMINSLFGKPEYAGEKLIRGVSRNAVNLMGLGGIAKTLNPLNLTAKNISKDVINTGNKNKEIYGKKYKSIWNDADKKGITDLSHIAPSIDVSTLRKYSPAKSIKGVEDFIVNPTTENAHIAKSDLLRIQRDLEKMTTLKTAERQHLKATKDAIEKIKNNMFKNASGNVDKRLLNKYMKTQKGYAKEVVPYKNKSINKFNRNEISSKELVNSLSHGEFRAKRGKYHRAIGIREMVKPTLQGVGGLAILNYLKNLYNESMGNAQPKEQ